MAVPRRIQILAICFLLAVAFLAHQSIAHGRVPQKFEHRHEIVARAKKTTTTTAAKKSTSTTKKSTTSSTKKTTTSTKKATSTTKKTTSSTKKATSTAKKTTSSTQKATSTTTKKTTVITTSSSKKASATSTKATATSSTKVTTSSSRKATTATSTKATTSRTTKASTSSSTKATASTTKPITSTVTSTRVSTTSSSSIQTTSTIQAKPPASTAEAGGSNPFPYNLALLYQNDLDWSTTDRHKGYLLVQQNLDRASASIACAALGEKLANVTTGISDLQNQFSYLVYRGVYSTGQSFWIGNAGQALRVRNDGSYTLETANPLISFPALCTQSASRYPGQARTWNDTSASFMTDDEDTLSRYEVTIGSSNVNATWTGYRDILSFRFLGIPYTNNPARFEYASAGTPANNTQALNFGAKCLQAKGGSEDCLYLNVWTPYLPGYKGSFYTPSLTDPSTAVASSTNANSLTSTATSTTSTTSTTTIPSSATAALTSTTTTPSTTTDTTTSSSTIDQNPAIPTLIDGGGDDGGDDDGDDGDDDNGGVSFDELPRKRRLDDVPGDDCYLKKRATSKSGLKPVMFWIYGGAFISGSGSDPTFDGGQLASRGDVVVITFNYRLGTLGFLPLGDGVHQGNYALSDCVAALQWVNDNIADFGGDASRVTIFGQSAGAQLVERLIGSSQAQGLFARAIVHSGRPADIYNAAVSVTKASSGAKQVVSALGCTYGSSNVFDCLQTVSEDLLTSNVFSRQVIDNTWISTAKYVIGGQGGHVNAVPLMMGYMRDEKASLGYAPASNAKNLAKQLQTAGVPPEDITVVLQNPDIFPTNVPNGVQNVTIEVQTNNGTVSRCGLAATAYAALSVMPSVWAYVYDQRAWQAPNYDPYDVCQPEETGGTAGDPSSYYFCHSGDLMATFATPGYAFKKNLRDDDDLQWITNTVDQWTAFARSGNPNPADGYNQARGYDSIPGDLWPQLTQSAVQMISLGPTQYAIPLQQHAAQCQAVDKPITYVARGG